MYYSSQDKEPAPSKWQSWAQEEDLQQKITGNLPSPKITHTRIPSPPPPPPPVFTKKRTQPNTDQIDFLSLDPPQCFCKRTAHRSFTLEYGPVLECSSYGCDKRDNHQSSFTCGFHVHELSWNKFKLDIKNGATITADFTELRACPLYNFTFCTLFHLTNCFDKIPPSVLPDCFCGNPVQLREKKQENFNRLYFSCKNSAVEGVKKCSWKLNAKEVAFTKPKHRLHRYVDIETYQRHQQEKKDHLQSKEQFKAQHHSDLLATLSAKTTTTAHNNLVVPTSVLAKKQPALPLSSSSSTSTSSTLSSPTFQKPTYELQEESNMLELSIMQIRRDAKLRIKEMETQLTKYMDKALKVEFDYKDKVALLKTDLEQESVLRLSGQERLSNIESEVVSLINEKEKIAKEYQDYKEEIYEKYGKDEEYNKCKVCFSKAIEYVLTPCFHLAYCERCAQKLKECAICRKEINGIHKIFSC